MFDSQQRETEAGMYESDLAREFATWIEQVTRPRTSNRAEEAAV